MTYPAPRGRPATPPEGSAAAGRTSSAVSAAGAPRDTSASPTADVSATFFFFSFFSSACAAAHAASNASSLSLSVCSVRVRQPAAVRRGDGGVHLPPPDGEAVLRGVPGSDLQLPPPAGLRRLRMLAHWHQRRLQNRLRQPDGPVQVSGNLRWDTPGAHVSAHAWLVGSDVVFAAASLESPADGATAALRDTTASPSASRAAAAAAASLRGCATQTPAGVSARWLLRLSGSDQPSSRTLALPL